MNIYEENQNLIEFLDRTPNSFFAVKNISEILEEKGFVRLFEGEEFSLKRGGCYYVTRNDSALIAFKVPKKKHKGFMMSACHGDSPALKIKTNAEICFEDKYTKLNVEKYGGMLCATWFDRPLSVAGRVVVNTKDGLETRLVNVDRDLLIIPNLAIHMNRDANSGYKYNAQKDMLPLYGTEEAKGSFADLIAKHANVKTEDILDTDLFLYNREKGTFIGEKEEFVASSRLDDLQCAYAVLQGFVRAKQSDNVSVYCLYDNEEVGSGSKQGAASTFLKDTLKRINAALGGNEEDLCIALQNSMMVSADNAHSVHPNYGEKADPTNRPVMNKGIVIKYSANQKYTTDAVSAGLFKKILIEAGVPFQTFANHSDIAGGSTLGNISTSQVALNTIDIGLAQMAMHSAYELAGADDTVYLIMAMEKFYGTSIAGKGDGNYTVK